MTKSIYTNLFKDQKGNDSNPFCKLRYLCKGNEENELQLLIRRMKLEVDIHSGYFPRNFDSICKRIPEYYSNVDYSINSLMKWGAELIGVFNEDINRFVELKMQYENAIFGEKYDLALRTLDDIEKKICKSSWTTYQRFLVLNLSNQREKIDSLLEKIYMHSSFISLLLFYYSKMADRTIGFEEFNINVERLLETIDKSNMGFKYFNFKLNLTQPKDIQMIRSALVLDEQISFIDYYETYIEALQILSGNDRYVRLIRDCVETLSLKNNDFRIRNLRVSLVNGKIKTDKSACEIIECYTSGNYDDVKRKAVDYIKTHPYNFEIYNLLMKSCEDINQLEIPHTEFWQEVNKLYLYNYDVRNSFRIIGNYYKLFHGTPWKYKILSLMSRKLNYKFGSNVLYNSMLNDSINTPMFYKCIRSYEEQLSYLSKFHNDLPVTTELLIYMITSEIDAKTILKIDPKRWKYYEIQSLMQRGEHSESIKKCSEILYDQDELTGKRYYLERIRRSLYNSYLVVGEIESAMNLYVDSFLIIEELVSHMDLKDLIKVLDDNNSDAIKSNVCRPIICNLFYKNSNDEVLTAYLDYIETKGCITLRQLLDQYKQLDEKDILFLNRVCTQSLLMRDYVSTSISGCSGAELRAEVLRTLLDYDKKYDRVKEYLNELNSIYKATQLQKKIDSFNHNRIFVDTENLYTYLNKDLENEFLKFKTVQEVKSIIKQGKKEDIERISFLSEQYWDQQRFFTNIIEKIKKEYLNESPYALECFLGTRIRHNFCNDNLKKVFESEKLFSKKKKDDSIDYIVNDYWKNKLCDEEYDIIIVELSRFSQSIDMKIQEIKDTWIRIKLDETGVGFFDYRNFTQLLISFYIFDERYFDNVSAFYELVVDELDNFTAQILQGIRYKIDSDLKPYYETSLKELEKNIRAIEFDGAVKSELIRNIELSKARYIDDIEAFKDIFNMEHEKYPDFTMEDLIEFCCEIENDMNSQFKNATVETNVKEDGFYNGSIFPYLVDIISILIRNAVEHSQLSMDNLHLGIDVLPYRDSKVHGKLASSHFNINSKYDNVVVFNISNNLAGIVDENSIRSKINERIENIYLMKFSDQSIQEGGSGLYKTARTIYYNLCSACEYFYEIENGVFDISIAIDLMRFLRKDLI